MSTIASQFGMPEALKALGIKEINDGTSTGSNSFSSGEIIESLRKSNAKCYSCIQIVSRNASTSTW